MKYMKSNLIALLLFEICMINNISRKKKTYPKNYKKKLNHLVPGFSDFTFQNLKTQIIF